MFGMEVGIASGEDKIMTATSSNQDLQVSISFGKFENDSLSWEKFSSFSPNKYLEEVEKCATPGSVAQKKAYFESHYKKIAERKAVMEQENQQLERNTSFGSSDHNQGNTDNSENEQNTSEEDKFVRGIATEVNETCNYEPFEETINIKECQSSAGTMNLEECTSSVNAGDDLNALKLEKLEEIVCVEEKPELIVEVEDKEKPKEVVCMEEEVKEEVRKDVSLKDTCKMNEAPVKETKKEKDHKLIKKTDKNMQTDYTRGSSKPNQVNKKPVASKIVMSRKTQPSKEKSMIRATNKAVSPVSKAPGFSTPRVSKPASTISSMSTSRSSVKKENVSTLPRKKQTASKALHISLNMDQRSTDPTALATAGKSLIMERMGDKEIIRRAFKSFQKSSDQMKPSGDGQDTAPKQVPAKASTVSRSATGGQKEMGRIAKSDAAEKRISSSHRSSPVVPQSKRTAEKQKEISRPGATAVDRIAKPKAVATNIKSRRQSLDPKVKSMHGPLPGSSDKVL